mmetsp:Transcript_8554/g.13206  ORF Transcript_8554/g.13206 Transcript_8554/m.13206 type:complete len:95 (-) Transcript_8554:682-966(-)
MNSDERVALENLKEQSRPSNIFKVYSLLDKDSSGGNQGFIEEERITGFKNTKYSAVGGFGMTAAGSTGFHPYDNEPKVMNRRLKPRGKVRKILL